MDVCGGKWILEGGKWISGSIKWVYQKVVNGCQRWSMNIRDDKWVSEVESGYQDVVSEYQKW